MYQLDFFTTLLWTLSEAILKRFFFKVSKCLYLFPRSILQVRHPVCTSALHALHALIRVSKIHHCLYHYQKKINITVNDDTNRVTPVTDSTHMHARKSKQKDRQDKVKKRKERQMG